MPRVEKLWRKYTKTSGTAVISLTAVARASPLCRFWAEHGLLAQPLHTFLGAPQFPMLNMSGFFVFVFCRVQVIRFTYLFIYFNGVTGDWTQDHVHARHSLYTELYPTPMNISGFVPAQNSLLILLKTSHSFWEPAPSYIPEVTAHPASRAGHDQPGASHLPGHRVCFSQSANGSDSQNLY